MILWRRNVTTNLYKMHISVKLSARTLVCLSPKKKHRVTQWLSRTTLTLFDSTLTSNITFSFSLIILHSFLDTVDIQIRSHFYCFWHRVGLRLFIFRSNEWVTITMWPLIHLLLISVIFCCFYIFPLPFAVPRGGVTGRPAFKPP